MILGCENIKICVQLIAKAVERIILAVSWGVKLGLIQFKWNLLKKKRYKCMLFKTNNISYT